MINRGLLLKGQLFFSARPHSANISGMPVIEDGKLRTIP